MTPNVCLAIYISTLLAESQISANWWEPLVASGPIGVVLLWFMLRSEKKTNEQTNSINNQVLMTAATILALKHGDSTIAELAARCKEQADRLAKHENSSG
jgi:hypothetical protein